MTGTWPLGFATGDVMNAAQFGKGIGAIFDSTLGGSAASIDITGIVTTYAHLLVVVYGRGDTASTSISLAARFNADAAANYDYQILGGSAAGVAASEAFAQNQAFVGEIPANTGGANLFGACMLFIPHYAGSANNKASVAVSSLKKGTSSGNMTTELFAGFWRSSAAINRITILASAGNLVAGTRMTIYGVGA